MTRPIHPFASAHYSALARNSEAIPMRTSPGSHSRKRAVLTYRQQFAERWAKLLHRHFDSPEEAAVFFGVDGSTARKQWAGMHAPSGFAVAMAYDAMPDTAAQMLMGMA